MNSEKKQNAIVLLAKYKPCDCHVCVEVLCSSCKITVFTEQEKMEIFNKNKDRAFHLCPYCLSLLKEAGKGRIVEVKLDKKHGETH